MRLDEPPVDARTAIRRSQTRFICLRDLVEQASCIRSSVPTETSGSESVLLEQPISRADNAAVNMKFKLMRSLELLLGSEFAS